MSTETIKALDSLLAHPGWQLFVEEARKRWGAVGYGRELKRAVTAAIESNQSAEAAIKAVDLANTEINALLSWPAEMLKRLEAQELAAAQPPSVSRRGPNL